MGTNKSLLAWPLRKLAFAALLTALGLIGATLWVFLHDGAFESSHRIAVQKLEWESGKLKAALADADQRMAMTRTEIAARKLRAEQAARVIRELDDLSSGLSRITTSSEQLKENDDRLLRMKQMEADSRKRADELEQGLIRIQWEKDGAEIAFERNQAKLTIAVVESSSWMNYARRAWDSYGTGILVGVALAMIFPAIWRLWRFSRS
jgi:chromosome segregation ATPase